MGYITFRDESKWAQAKMKLSTCTNRVEYRVQQSKATARMEDCGVCRGSSESDECEEVAQPQCLQFDTDVTKLWRVYAWHCPMDGACQMASEGIIPLGVHYFQG